MKYALWFIGTIFAILIALLLYVAIMEQNNEPAMRPLSSKYEITPNYSDVPLNP